MLRAFPVLVVFAAISVAALAESRYRSSSGIFRVSYQSQYDPISINRIHSWVLFVEDAHGVPVTGASIAVQGGMPAHDHGLPTSPRVIAETGEGEYLLEGMRFHMPGTWAIEITIEAGGKRDIVVIPLNL